MIVVIVHQVLGLRTKLELVQKAWRGLRYRVASLVVAVGLDGDLNGDIYIVSSTISDELIDWDWHTRRERDKKEGQRFS